MADAIGRKKAFLVSFVISGASVAYLFPFEHSYTTYLAVIPIVGFGLFGALSGNFVYGPEMFAPSMRASGIALANSIGRYVTAAGPLVAGVIASSWFGGNLGLATAVLAATGIIALIGLYFAPETRDAELPTDAPADVPQDHTSVKGISS
jgi:MFS family permease